MLYCVLTTPSQVSCHHHLNVFVLNTKRFYLLGQRTGFFFPVRAIIFLSLICYCLNKTACHLFIAGFKRYIYMHNAECWPLGGNKGQKKILEAVHLQHLSPVVFKGALAGCAHMASLAGRHLKELGLPKKSQARWRNRLCSALWMHRSLC